MESQNNMRRFLNLTAVCGIGSLVTLFALGALLWFCDYALGLELGSLMVVAQIAAFLAVLMCLICTFVLWVEGWVFIFEKWGARPAWLNPTLIALQLFCGFFVAYIFHFMRNRASGCAGAVRQR